MTALIRPAEIHLGQACVWFEEHGSRSRQSRRILNLLFCRQSAIWGMLRVPKRKTIAGVVGIAVPVGHTDVPMWLGSVPDVPDTIRILTHRAISFFLVIVVRRVEFAFLVEGKSVRITDAPGKQLGLSPVRPRPIHAGAAP